MKTRLSASLTIITLLLLFLAFNLVWALKLPNPRLDFSEQNIHTLSDPVQTMLGSLERPVDLYFFNSSNRAHKANAVESYAKRVELLLKEYEKAAKGKINLHLIDPTLFLKMNTKPGYWDLTNNTDSSAWWVPARAMRP